MTPEEEDQQHHFFNRGALSDQVDARPYPYQRPSQPENQLSRGVSININELHHVPVEQQPQALMNEAQWTKYIAEKIDQAGRPEFPRNKTIYSVPRALFEVRPRSYCPRVATIGPLCRKLEPLPMDNCKALCLREFMARRDVCLEELMDHVIPAPENLRNIYIGVPNYNIETLKLLLTMDSVFIHEFFNFWSRGISPEDEVCGYLSSFLNDQLMTFSQLTRDLFLMGNQVPITFLRRLTELPNQDLTPDDLLVCLESVVWSSNPFCLSHQGSTDSQYSNFESLIKAVSFLDCEHLLDCLYITCVQQPNEESPQEFNRPLARLPTASNLSKVGIKFKAGIGNTAVMRYHKKSLRLYLPKLIVFDVTEDIFRNLIAYELTSTAGGQLCGYALIMDSLIDTAEDLAILYRAGVLENHLGSDERLLRMWNDMCVNILERPCGRWEVMKEEVRHTCSKWRVIRMEFYMKFFSRPWLLLSAIAALLLLGMSALQTIYSVAAYYKTKP